LDWIDCWQKLPYLTSPYLFEIGSFELRYYSLMYLLAFLLTYVLVSFRIKQEKLPYSKETIQDYFLWAILGLIIGARFGYTVIYNLPYYLENPLEIILPFSFSGGIHFTGISGMSYHGGLVGLLVASALFCRRRKIDFLRFADLMAPAVPLGFGFGRIGNFLNGELYGRLTNVAWGMYFPLDPSGRLRHPSQLYAFALEGLLLFAVLWTLRRIKGFPGLHLCLYLIGYGLARITVEFFRQPDPQLGFLFNHLSMGQILSGLMILAGIGLGITLKAATKPSKTPRGK